MRGKGEIDRIEGIQREQRRDNENKEGGSIRQMEEEREPAQIEKASRVPAGRFVIQGMPLVFEKELKGYSTSPQVADAHIRRLWLAN